MLFTVIFPCTVLPNGEPKLLGFPYNIYANRFLDYTNALRGNVMVVFEAPANSHRHELTQQLERRYACTLKYLGPAENQNKEFYNNKLVVSNILKNPLL